MIQLSIDGESSPRYVILRGIERKGGTGDPIHIDFFQVDPEQPIQANVPLRLTGESPAVTDETAWLPARAAEDLWWRILSGQAR